MKPEKPKADNVTQVPSHLETTVVLKPGDTKEVSIKMEQDMILHGLETEQDGPVLIRIKKQDQPSRETQPPTLEHGNFQDYLDRELPEHLALLVDEELSAWHAKNQSLLALAKEGDDEAFFDLLARDPRYLQSEFTLRRILTWRTQIDTYNRYFRYKAKASQFWTSDHGMAEALAAMEHAKKNLHRFGTSQVALYDLRGKNPLPPAEKVRGIYYGVLCLLNGLRSVYRDLHKNGLLTSEIEKQVTVFVTQLQSVKGTSLFLPYIIAAACLILNREICTKAGFHDPSLLSLFQGRDVTPSDTARHITASAFDIHKSTVERLCAANKPILLESSDQEDVFLGGRPPFELLTDFPEIHSLYTHLTR